jgi:hypothetical protein
MIIISATIKNENPWLSIFPWNVKPVAKPNITAVIAENKKINYL